MFWLMARGVLSNRQMAVEIRIAEKTMKVHRGRVMGKMEVDSVANITRMALRLGANPDPD